ncbi:MAG TPA: hypothetical protein VGM03_24260 [Phycisphaerae bacterium]
MATTGVELAAPQRAAEVVVDVPNRVDASELLEFYRRQGHATTHSIDKLERMIANSFCFVTARQNGSLIGIARGVTDGVRGHIIECKLDPACQGPGCVTRVDGRIEHDSAGIARTMAERVIGAFRQAGVERIDVVAYGTEVDFCEDLGFRRVAGLVPLSLDTRRSGATTVGTVSRSEAVVAAK